MRAYLRIIAVAAGLALPCATAAAQHLPVSVAVGIGGGWAGTTCSGCIASNENGPAGLVRLTTPLTDGLRLGAEYSRWSRMQYGERSAFDYYMAVAELRTSELPAFSVSAGAGYGRTRFRQWDVSTAPITTERAGFAYELGVAYDLRLGDRFSVAPYSQIVMTRSGPASINGQPSPEHHQTGIVEYGVLFRLH